MVLNAGRAMLALLMVLTLATACRTTTGRSAGQVVDDAAITAQVKARLAAAEAETLGRIDVDTTNGVVYLTGTVDTAAMKARAEEIARTEEGVRRVVNNLQVRAR
ncbi:MAG TPA: BON domain-containing protein [Candidatus Tectomicrobia bacterium]|nr:BON domain-containing protein [Candidatus Tectomicrobia bacterium]